MTTKTVPTFASPFASDMLRRGLRTFVEEAAERESDATIGEAVTAYLDAIEEAAHGLRAEAGLRARRTSGRTA